MIFTIFKQIKKKILLFAPKIVEKAAERRILAFLKHIGNGVKLSLLH